MKTLILFILCFWLLPALPACDEATPDYPINVIDDGLYLILESGDRFKIELWNHGCIVVVTRSYSDDADLVFREGVSAEINHVHISRQPEP